MFKFGRRFMEAVKEGGEGASESGSLMDLADNGEPAAPEGQPAANGEWFLAEGLKGEGDLPEWFNAAKYKTVADQARAQRELEKRFGGFTGAPEEYELSLPEGFEGEFDMEHPILQDFIATAKEANMDQGTFSKLLHRFVEYEATAGQVDLSREREALGPKAGQRIGAVRDYLKANLSEEHYDAMRASLQTAAAVEALETLIGKTRAPLPGQDADEPTTSSLDSKISALADEKDDQGRRLIEVDPAKRAEYRALLKRRHGDRPYQEVIGR